MKENSHCEVRKYLLCLVCALSEAKGMVIKMIEIILTMVVLSIILLIINKQVKKEEEIKKLIREKEEQRGKIKEERRERELNKVIQFALNNGIDNINKLIEERNDLYIQATRYYLLGALTEPFTPITVKAKYSGGVADYCAEKINKERQQEYNNSLVECREYVNIGMTHRERGKDKEKLIFDKLKSIPNSDEYINILRQQFDEDDKVFKQTNE